MKKCFGLGWAAWLAAPVAVVWGAGDPTLNPAAQGQGKPGIVTVEDRDGDTLAGQVRVLHSQSTGDLGYGYGFDQWDNFSAALDAATGNGIDVVSDFNDLNLMMQYDAIFLDQRWTSGTLSRNEVGNIGAFVATGRRAILMGENESWANWNNQILGLLGGSFAGGTGGTITAVIDHPITENAATLSIPAGGLAQGGTSLYNQSVVTLWGDDGNVVVLLDVNVVDDTFGNQADNAQFTRNLATWLAEGGSACNGTEFIQKAKCKVSGGVVRKATVLVRNTTPGQEYTCDLATGQSRTETAGGDKLKFKFSGPDAPPLGPNTATVCDGSQDFNC